MPEERVVFTGDTVFSECQTWLMTSDIDQWVGALDQISALDVDTVVPGHGPVTTLAYLATQRAVLLEWTSAVAEAVAKGWSREETIARVDFARHVRSGRRRAGLHDGPHPDAERRLAVGQVHRQASTDALILAPRSPAPPSPSTRSPEDRTS